MKWELKAKKPDNILETLLSNRGIKTKKDIELFLNPPTPYLLTSKDLGIDEKQLVKAVDRIVLAVKNKEPVVVYGDYDVDGICSTAIIWETLRDMKAVAMPFIPSREKEGYGLSIEGIKNILADTKYGLSVGNKGLLITVDNGIVAHEAVEFANKNGLEVIILDHHEVDKKNPDAFAVVHTEKLCAGGISFFVSDQLYKVSNLKGQGENKLELAAIASVADLIPLVGPNRSIVKHGISALNKTRRLGLLALFEVAGIKKVGTYEIGYLIGPRINASGRIESALTALRMLCTSDKTKAEEYAKQLNSINQERQAMLEEMVIHAKESMDTLLQPEDRIIVLEHNSYHQGVIGLIAGKLVEKYYLPSIVIAKGETISKASARSIAGFNIIESIRTMEHLLMGAGGHPMAAGFSIESIKIEEFKKSIGEFAKTKITDQMLEKTLNVDCELELSKIKMDFFQELSQLSPYGMGNPEPVFESEVMVEEVRTIGAEGKHLKMLVTPVDNDQENLIPHFDAIAFGKGDRAKEIKPGDKISLAYNLDLNEYNGSIKLQLKIKDFKL